MLKNRVFLTTNGFFAKNDYNPKKYATFVPVNSNMDSYDRYFCLSGQDCGLLYAWV
jgi:hypothetical protein